MKVTPRISYMNPKRNFSRLFKNNFNKTKKTFSYICCTSTSIPKIMEGSTGNSKKEYQVGQNDRLSSVHGAPTVRT